MDGPLLWIVKDPKSKTLSRSARSEEVRIRRHVQQRCLRTPATVRTVCPGSQADKVRPAADSTALRPRHGVTIVGQSVQVQASLGLDDQQLDRVERRSLSMFIQRNACECAGWQDRNFWTSTVLRISHHNRAITHGLIAMAAWHESCSFGTGTDDAKRLSRMSSVQYSKALAMARSSNSSTHICSLTLCLVLACFQSARCEYEMYRLLRSGVALLGEINAGGLQISPAEQAMVDVELRPLIERQQTRLCMMADNPAALVLSAHQRRCAGLARRAAVSIPSVFSTLRCARDCLESILEWAHDRVLDAHDCLKSLEFFRSLLRERVKRWRLALDKSEFGDSSNRTKSLLKIAALSGTIMLVTAPVQHETEFDAEINAFREIMHLLTQTPPTGTNHEHGRVSFGLDGGLIDIVAFVGTRCRDPEIRRSVIKWLSGSSRLEGERLSSASGHIIQRWMDLEEGGDAVQSCAEIPESRRRRLLSGERFHSRKLVKLTFVSAPYTLSAGALVDDIWLNLGDQTDYTTGFAPGPSEQVMPDAKFFPCHAAFLRDPSQGTYHDFGLKQFFFPIPRM